MKPEGTPVAAITILDIRLPRCGGGPTLGVDISGRGILTPGVAIPDEWWDRPRLVPPLTVYKPQATAEGKLAFSFGGYCPIVEGRVLGALVYAGDLEAVAREIAPTLLEGLAKTLGPGDDKPAKAKKKRAAGDVADDLLRLALGQAGLNRKKILQEAFARGMSDPLVTLVLKSGTEGYGPPPAIPEPPPRPKVRVRLVDT